MWQDEFESAIAMVPVCVNIYTQYRPSMEATASDLVDVTTEARYYLSVR